MASAILFDSAPVQERPANCISRYKRALSIASCISPSSSKPTSTHKNVARTLSQWLSFNDPQVLRHYNLTVTADRPSERLTKQSLITRKMESNDGHCWLQISFHPLARPNACSPPRAITSQAKRKIFIYFPASSLTAQANTAGHKVCRLNGTDLTYNPV